MLVLSVLSRSFQNQPVLDVPGYGANAQEAAYVCATTIVDISREPETEIVREGNAVCADIGLYAVRNWVTATI